MSTTLVIVTAFVANAFMGFNSLAWTWPIWTASLFGPLAIIIFSLFYSAFAPSFVFTDVYGNYFFLFASASFWFGVPLVLIFSMLPNYLYRVYRAMFSVRDLDIARPVQKAHPDFNWQQDPRVRPSTPVNLPDAPGHAPIDGPRRPSFTERRSYERQQNPIRPSMDERWGSRTDMSTGSPYTRSGYIPHAEDNDVAIRRFQSRVRYQL